jgi:hypothetical protein
VQVVSASTTRTKPATRETQAWMVVLVELALAVSTAHAVPPRPTTVADARLRTSALRAPRSFSLCFNMMGPFDDFW